MAKCIICGGDAGRRDVCERCKRVNHVPDRKADWPEWLKEMRRMDRAQAREDEHIDAYANLDDECWTYDVDGGRHTHPLPMNA